MEECIKEDVKKEKKEKGEKDEREKEDTLHMSSIDSSLWILGVDKYISCLSNRNNLKG